MKEHSKHYLFFEKLVTEITEAELGNMFGKQCGKLKNKAFYAFFKDEMVFKIGREEVDVLLEKYENAQRWDPSGKNRAMKDWIQVPQEFMDDWRELTKKAVSFMA